MKDPFGQLLFPLLRRVFVGPASATSWQNQFPIVRTFGNPKTRVRSESINRRIPAQKELFDAEQSQTGQ
jgi:hypothetical protein